MKHILVTGGNGQLGCELKSMANLFPEMHFTFSDLPELDISNSSAIESFLQQQSIDVLINCAAYTAVDKAESEPEKAELINAKAPGILAQAAVRHGFSLVHISTDYVFNGQHFKPYKEYDFLAPVSAYGKSKMEGETAVLQTNANALIIRTSWLYSAYGHNFAKTIYRLAKERDELKVVFDQIGTPTYAADLAESILNIVQNYKLEGCRVYHYSNEGACSWFDFARTIVDLAGLQCRIVAIPTSEFPTPAPRPHYSVLDKSTIKNDFNLEIPWWCDSVKKCMAILEA